MSSPSVSVKPPVHNQSKLETLCAGGGVEVGNTHDYSYEHYTYAVIGGGIAGVSCVEQILELQPDAKIVLISSSPAVKMASNVIRLTKTLEDFIVVEKSLKSFKNIHPNVKVVQDEIIKLETSRSTLFTKGGSAFQFSRMCICTGAIPKLVFPGHEHVVGIRDTHSVQDLGDQLKRARRVLLIGNGGIATEFVHEASGIEIIWSVKDKSIAANYIDAGAAEFFIQARASSELKPSAQKPVKNITKNPPISAEAAKSSMPSGSGSHTVGVENKDSDDNSDVDSDDGFTVEPCKRMKYTLAHHSDSSPTVDSNKFGATETEKVLGSALGPDWHEGLCLSGRKAKKNVIIEYDTGVCRLFTSEEYKSQYKYCVGEEEDWPVYAELTNGHVYSCDLVISATGVVPKCPWFPGESNPTKGIIVDGAMQTSIQGIFAAGDVCFADWPWPKHWFQMRLWTQARQMGLYAAKTMIQSLQVSSMDVDPESFVDVDTIDRDFCFELFSHVTRFFGFKVVLLGLYNGQGLDPSRQHLLLRCTKNMEYIKVVLEDWRMQGAILIGDTGLEETFENLILNQTDLSSYGEDLLNPGIDIQDYFD